MTKDEVREALMAACGRLVHSGGKIPRDRWQREMNGVYAAFEQLSEDDQQEVDLEPLVMMEPGRTPSSAR